MSRFAQLTFFNRPTKQNVGIVSPSWHDIERPRSAEVRASVHQYDVLNFIGRIDLQHDAFAGVHVIELDFRTKVCTAKTSAINHAVEFIEKVVDRFAARGHCAIDSRTLAQKLL